MLEMDYPKHEYEMKITSFTRLETNEEYNKRLNRVSEESE